MRGDEAALNRGVVTRTAVPLPRCRGHRTAGAFHCRQRGDAGKSSPGSGQSSCAGPPPAQRFPEITGRAKPERRTAPQDGSKVNSMGRCAVVLPEGALPQQHAGTGENSRPTCDTRAGCPLLDRLAQVLRAGRAAGVSAVRGVTLLMSYLSCTGGRTWPARPSRTGRLPGPLLARSAAVGVAECARSGPPPQHGEGKRRAAPRISDSSISITQGLS